MALRDVLAPVHRNPHVAIYPMQLPVAETHAVVAEVCPSSYLKRHRLPHRLYKQSGGRRPSVVHRTNRRATLTHLTSRIRISTHRRRVILADPGGDALDAVIAAVAVARAWHFRPPSSSIDPRHRREGQALL